LKFGPSTYSRSFAFSVDPWVPAASSVWQPEQLCWKITAPS
jgi:hypothetical protein